MYIPIQNCSLKENFKNSNLKVLNGHKKRVYCLDWNSDGSKLVSGSVDTTIRVT
jgi:WD40 repeat protein